MNLPPNRPHDNVDPRLTDALAQLELAWQRSDAIFAVLADLSLMARPIALRHPFLFYLGHLPAFASNQVLTGLLGRSPLHGDFEVVFERGIDPLSASDGQNATRTMWPAVATVLRYRDRVRDAMRASLSDATDARIGEHRLPPHLAYHLVLEHELMHHETLLYMMQALDLSEKTTPTDLPTLRLDVRSRGDVTDTGNPSADVIQIPAGMAVLGTTLEKNTFAWDIELSEVSVAVPSFGLDRHAVTNSDYLAFMAAGGYGLVSLWTPDDWAWKTATGLAQPQSWRHDGERWLVRWMFGEVPLQECGAWPVQVSQAEASAFAKWRGARLPTEAELAWAAHGSSPPPDGLAHNGPTHSGQNPTKSWAPHPVFVDPAPSRHGVEQLLSNGWEWTSTPFRPLPGFATWHRSYLGYSSDFFDDKHFVVFGSSWATGRALQRRSFRNWYQAHYPYVFSKFRLGW